MTFLLFLAVLGLLVFVHELGHFSVAKWARIRVDEFAIFMGPKLFGKRRGETEYTLRAIPLGGYVTIYGEDPTEEHYNETERERSFVGKPRYIQAAVLVAGVAMNVVLAYVLYVGIFMLGMPTALDETDANMSRSDAKLLVTATLPETPAAQALRMQDELLRLRSGERTLDITARKSPSAVIAFIAESGGQEVSFDVVRDGSPLTVSLTPRNGVLKESPDRAAAGFMLNLVAMEHMSLIHAVPAAAVQTWTALSEVARGLWGFVRQAVVGSADLSQVSGPLGIVGLVGQQAHMGLTWLLSFIALISLNLAVINILPIPALDGGRLLFVAIEAVIRRPIKPIIATRTNQIGFIALLVLIALVTVGDLHRFDWHVLL